MKKFFVLILIMILLCSCSTKNEVVMYSVIDDIRGGYLYVEDETLIVPFSSDDVYNQDDEPYEISNEDIGKKVKIVYSGSIMESYPGEIAEVYRIIVYEYVTDKE